MSLNKTVHLIFASPPVLHPDHLIVLAPPPLKVHRYKNETPPNDDGHHSHTESFVRHPPPTPNLTPRNFAPSSPACPALSSSTLPILIRNLSHRDGQDGIVRCHPLPRRRTSSPPRPSHDEHRPLIPTAWATGVPATSICYGKSPASRDVHGFHCRGSRSASLEAPRKFSLKAFCLFLSTLGVSLFFFSSLHTAV
jgi:hypothetical protein